ncbi:MAG TPA: Asp-tRNA(Asn)/Glu-tRNA(Gln) amidotransferase subunit GatC [Labilithrix sp.]
MDVALIRHVAKLAELSLSEDEERKMADEIGKIVAYVEELSAIDTTDVPPTAHIGISGGQDAWRADAAREGLSHEDALREAPRAEHEGFAVPTFVES